MSGDQEFEHQVGALLTSAWPRIRLCSQVLSITIPCGVLQQKLCQHAKSKQHSRDVRWRREAGAARGRLERRGERTEGMLFNVPGHTLTRRSFDLSYTYAPCLVYIGFTSRRGSQGSAASKRKVRRWRRVGLVNLRTPLINKPGLSHRSASFKRPRGRDNDRFTSHDLVR